MILTDQQYAELIAFLDARIAEDQDVANRANESDPAPWALEPLGAGEVRDIYDTPVVDAKERAISCSPDDGVRGGHDLRTAVHIARHHPGRTLLECELKRLIVDAHRPEDLSQYSDDELHSRFGHPEWEYTSVEVARKSGADDSPPDDSWEPNDFIDMGCAPDGTPYPRRNWERFDYTEETYYRRRRTEPQKRGVPDLLVAMAKLYSDHPDYRPEWREDPK